MKQSITLCSHYWDTLDTMMDGAIVDVQNCIEGAGRSESDSASGMLQKLVEYESLRDFIRYIRG
jgi:hypothetical protein